MTAVTVARLTGVVPSPSRALAWRRVLHSPAAVIGLVLTFVMTMVAIFATRIAPASPFTTSAALRFRGPSWGHVMGTDHLGRDIFTGVVQGAKTSLTIVAGVVVIAALIGIVVGTQAGLRGGLLDDTVTRITETVQTVPRFFLAILAIAWFGPGRTTLILVLGLTSWPLIARVARAETLSLRERGFVEAARAAGSSRTRILTHHIVPNVLPSALVVIALTGSRVVLLEAGLAFLGLADPNVASWGTLINNAQPYLERAWWMSVFPGAAIVVTVLAINLLADGVSQTLDPLGRR